MADPISSRLNFTDHVDSSVSLSVSRPVVLEIRGDLELVPDAPQLYFELPCHVTALTALSLSFQTSSSNTV